MLSSRLSNRSVLGSRLKKNQTPQTKLLTSSQYLQLCKSRQQTPDQLVFDSLNYYEKQINSLKAFLLLSEAKINHFKKLHTLTQIKQFVQKIPKPLQPITDDEKLAFKPTFLTQKRRQCIQLAQILEQKQQQQRKTQSDFLRAITEQYQQDKMKEILATINIQRILNRKVTKKQQQSFISIRHKVSPQKPNQKLIKNVLTSSFMMLSIKIKYEKEFAFKTLLKQFGLGSIVDQMNTNLKVKGKALMELKQYPRLNLRRAFWRWHLSTTDLGEKLFQKAADKLVLYTNINKTTFFYRLYNQVKVKQIKVDPNVKRMTVMFYLYSKIIFERPMRTFFEKVKIFTQKSGKQFACLQSIVINSQLRQKDLLKKWLNKTKQIKEQQKAKKVMLSNLAKRIIEVSKQKKLFFIQEWKKLTDAKLKENKLKEEYLKKLLLTKSGRVLQAFRCWKMLPQKVNIEAFRKASKFEKGLTNFIQRTITRAIDSFKNEYEKAQVEKKRAVIQLIDMTQSGQKRYFIKWKAEVLKQLLYQRCQMLGRVFENTKNCLHKNFSLFYRTKQYNLREVSVLQRFLTKVSDNTNESIYEMIDSLKENAQFYRVNKWFQKSAEILAVKTHISIEKSFWRLKLNAWTNHIPHDSQAKMKLQKLCKNMGKYYELTLYRAFVVIEKFGKSLQNTESMMSNNNNNMLKINSTLKEESTMISNFQTNQAQSLKEESLLYANRKASVGLCENVFNQSMINYVRKWQQNTQQGRFMTDSSQLIRKQHPQISIFINQQQACSLINEKLKAKRLLNISTAFRSVLQKAFISKQQPLDDQNLQQRLQLINRQTKLMQQIQQYKKENETLLQELQVKQSYLIESNKTVTVLSLRINFMVIHKFVSIVEKVINANEWKCLNEGLDAVIERANFNFELEQSQKYIEYDEK